MNHYADRMINKELTAIMNSTIGNKNEAVKQHLKAALRHMVDVKMEEFAAKMDALMLDSTNVCVADVFREVCNEFNVTAEELKMTTRKPHYCIPRQVVQWMLYRRIIEKQLSAEFIGEITGGYDHSTVKHSANRIDEYLFTDHKFRKRVMTLCEKLYCQVQWTGKEIRVLEYLPKPKNQAA